MNSDLPHPRVERTIVTLQNLGHNVVLFVVNYGETISNINVTCNIIRVNAPTIIHKISALSFSLDLYSSFFINDIKKAIKNINPDLLYVNNILISRAVLHVNKRYNIPTILDVHENYASISKYYPYYKNFIYKLLVSNNKIKTAQKNIYSQFDNIIFVTDEAAKYSIKNEGVSKDKITVLTNTIHPNLFLKYPVNDKLNSSFKNKFITLYLGDLGLRRGMDFIIDSFYDLIKEFDDIILVLVGSSKEDKLLKQKIRNLKLEKYIFFEGWKNENLFPSYIKSSDLCLCPINKNEHHNSTHANKLFQYMSGGKPILASNCDSQELLIKRTNSGLIYSYDDKRDFKNKFLKLYFSDRLRKYYGNNGLNAVKNKYSWENQSKDFVNLINSISKKTKV